VSMHNLSIASLYKGGYIKKVISLYQYLNSKTIRMKQRNHLRRFTGSCEKVDSKAEEGWRNFSYDRILKNAFTRFDYVPDVRIRFVKVSACKRKGFNPEIYIQAQFPQ